MPISIDLGCHLHNFGAPVYVGHSHSGDFLFQICKYVSKSKSKDRPFAESLVTWLSYEYAISTHTNTSMSSAEMKKVHLPSEKNSSTSANLLSPPTVLD